MKATIQKSVKDFRMTFLGHMLDTVQERRRLKRVGKWALGIFRGVFLFSLCLVLLYPLLIMLSISLRVPSELFDQTVVWIPKTVSFDAFYTVWNHMNFMGAFLQTGLIAVIGTLFQLISCILAGYGFARFRFPLKRLLFGIMVFSIIVPPQVITIPSMIYFQKFDLFGFGWIAWLFTGKPYTVPLYNSLWSYFLPALTGAGIRSGLFIFIFAQFFRGLPYELQDAAYIDGCGRFRTFWKIMLPLSGGAVLTVLLFSLVWYWNDSLFNVIYFDNLRTVSGLLQNISFELANIGLSENTTDLGKVTQTQAAALISIVPVFLMYVALQKYFTESIERTGIVG